MRWMSRVRCAPQKLRNDPTCPFRTCSSPPLGTAGPVWSHAAGVCVSWPSFSSSVISASTESARRIAPGDDMAASSGDVASAESPARWPIAIPLGVDGIGAGTGAVTTGDVVAGAGVVSAVVRPPQASAAPAIATIARRALTGTVPRASHR
jgi:hypothetical protein